MPEKALLTNREPREQFPFYPAKGKQIFFAVLCNFILIFKLWSAIGQKFWLTGGQRKVPIIHSCEAGLVLLERVFGFVHARSNKSPFDSYSTPMYTHLR